MRRDAAMSAQKSLWSITPWDEDPRALSLLPPWTDAILRGGKRIENRIAWTNSHFRGHFYLHASKASIKTRREYGSAIEFAIERGLSWRPQPYGKLLFGGIVGVAKVIGVVTEKGGGHPFSLMLDSAEQRLWWMGKFALVLDDVRPLPFVPCKGALGFFRVPPDVLSALRKAA